MLTHAVSVILGLLTVLIGTPYARKYLLSSGIYGIDQQKIQKPKLPTSGGIVVLFGFIFSVTAFLAIESFYSTGEILIAELLAALNSVIIIALIGLIDDIHIDLENLFNEHSDSEVEIDLLGDQKAPETDLLWEKISVTHEKEGSGDVHRKGLDQLYKMMFVLPAVLPLIAVGAGSWAMTFPVIGTVNWGLFYPLVLLPLGLLFVSNVVNMLAGTNGLSTGISMIAASGLGIFAVLNSKPEAAIISFSLAGSLLAFFYYNRYPASILPGDSLTYLSGAALFSAMVIGDMEKFGVFIFAPYFLEFLLKARSGFRAHSWGIIRQNGKLESQYEKIYSITHPLMSRGFDEKQITYTLMALEAFLVAGSLILFVYGAV